MLPNKQNQFDSSLPSGLDEMESAAHIIVRRGDLCPRCGFGNLDYNGLLDLECPFCGFGEVLGGSCT
jgi:hypothetical protein